MTTKMTKKQREAERHRLALQINEWNANRYDLFAITLPNEDNEYFGVMRFFFQEAGSRVSTKCIRVSNTASTQDVLNTLVEKFRPDMRMLTLPKYALYEVHVNGEERKLREDEFPLIVQLNWGQDDREGRFLLKNMDEKTILPKTDSITNTTENPAPVAPGFKRKLSKREKKEQKKLEKEAKLKDKENTSPGKDGVAEKLYNEVPDTSFTRSISNPEAVMRRRRQLKLEKKLQQIRSQDGGPDQGGTLKIYGESIRPDVPYKTLLLSTHDSAVFVVKETLEKYGMEKEDPDNYCLVQVLLPPGGPEYHGPGWGGHNEVILEDDDCPLAIVMHTPPAKGTVMFHLKRRPPEMVRHKKKRSSSESRMNRRDEPRTRSQKTPESLPYINEINPDGSEPYKARKFALQPNITEVGSEQNLSQSPQYMQLHGPDIYPHHCVFTFSEGLVTVTPTPQYKEAETYVNEKRIYQTTILQHGMVVRFGKMHLYRFCDPIPEKHGSANDPRHSDMAQDYRGGPNQDIANFETTFDVDGHVETKSGPLAGPQGEGPMDTGMYVDRLPCSLQYKEEGEDAFLATVISDVNTTGIHFKLAPTYTLYMAMRYRLHRLARMNLSPEEKGHWIDTFSSKIVNMIQRTIQEHRANAPALSFWMANTSELLHFLKQDVEVTVYTKICQDELAQNAVQSAFHHLVDCMQVELHQVMPAFLDESMEDLQEHDDMGHSMYQKGKPTINDVLQVLSAAMSLLRRCRVNAALTIQLFSQLFHFINMWLFNKVVLEPQLQLCTAGWGHRLKRRLGRVEIWAEKHGLELAADCHLARIIQAAHLLEAPKGNPDDIANISSTCFKLNSLQLRALLECYIPSPGEHRIPHEFIMRVISVAENMSDELLKSEGREVRLEEDQDLQLPFLLPEDGYSCDIVNGVPSGLADFLSPVTTTGLCQFHINKNSESNWTVYMGYDNQNLHMGGPAGPMGGAGGPQGAGAPQDRDGLPTSMTPPQAETLPPGLQREPEVAKVTFNKVKGSIGLSIVAAKGDRQKERGIYIKSVVAGGGAALDGRLQAGDQLLKVDGKTLVGLTQERAAEHMMHTGQTVTLEVAKQAAIYHGLTSLLTQPSPIMARGSPNRGAPPMPAASKLRPKSEDVSRFTGPDSPRREDSAWDSVEKQRPLHLQHGAKSSPNLPDSRTQEAGPEGPGYYSNQGMKAPQQQYPAGPGPGPYAPGQPKLPPGVNQNQFRPDPREIALRSKSTTHLEQTGGAEQRFGDPRNTSSVSTLPRSQPQPQPPQLQQQRFQSHPDLNRYEDRPDSRNKTYENFPAATGNRPPQPQSQQPYGDPRRDQDREIKPAQSMGNIRQEPPRQDMSSRPRSEEFDRRQMQEWQQQQQRQQNESNNQNWRPGGPGPPPYGPQRGPPSDRDIPRSQANNQQYQQSFYQNTAPRPRGPEPQFDVTRTPEGSGMDPRGRPSTDSKPPTSRPSVTPQEVPRVDSDPRRTQQQFFNQCPQPSAKGGPTGQYPPNQGGQFPPSSSGYSYTQSVPDPRTPQASGNRPYDRQQSPDLPPPPAVPPPVEDHGDELPPPPSQDTERQIREEEERMMRRWDSLGRPQPTENQRDSLGRGQGPDFSRDPQRESFGRSQAPRESMGQPQDPYKQRPSVSSSQNYQNLPPTSSTSTRPQAAMASASTRPQPTARHPEPESPAPELQYHYAPRPAPPQNIDKSIMERQKSIESDVSARILQHNNQPTSQAQQRLQPTQPPPAIRKKPPPIATKPKVEQSGPSPWEREQKERESRQQEDEARLSRQQQINELSKRPYLSRDDEEKLRRLMLDEEFDRRVRETKDDDDGDSDTDMTNRAVGRAKVLQLMHRDAERRQQQQQEEKQQRQRQEGQAEADKLERQERRLAQFEQERGEQKLRLMKRQEKKAQETEEYLKKQRDLRDRQRQEFEEQRQLQKQEEERQRERQREEIRKKKEMEKEAMREIQVAREEEEERQRRQQSDQSQQRIMERMQDREAQMRKEFQRMDFNRAPESGSRGHERGSEGPSRPDDQPGASMNNINGPPAPPERKSSYDIYSKSGSMSNLGHVDLDMGAPTRSMSTSALRQQQQQQAMQDNNPYKKSVSFNSNLITEIHETRYGSTSSESSNREYNSQSSQDGSYPGASPTVSSPYQGQQTPYQPSQAQQTPTSGPYASQPNSAPYQTPPSSAAYQNMYQPSQSQQAPYQPTQAQQPQYQPSQGQMYQGQQPPNSMYLGDNNNQPPPLPTSPPPDSPTLQRSRPATSQPESSSGRNEPFQRPHYGPPPTTPAGHVYQIASPAGNTPGVIGAQEVYRDPRDRIAASKVNNNNLITPGQEPQRMSFRDKMSMFAKEAGENTPQERSKISLAQRRLEAQS